MKADKTTEDHKQIIADAIRIAVFKAIGHFLIEWILGHMCELMGLFDGRFCGL